MLMAITRPRKLLYMTHDPFPEEEGFELQTCQTDRTPAHLQDCNHNTMFIIYPSLVIL